MPYLKVEIPYGPYCNGCIFNPKGTVICELFYEYLNEVEIDDPEKEGLSLYMREKCKECVKAALEN